MHINSAGFGRLWFVAIAAIAFSWTGTAHAVLAGRVSSLQGDVSVTRLGELNARPVTKMMEIHVNDQITTGTDGRVRILFVDDSVVSLAENSKLRVSKQVYNPVARQRESVIDLFRGRVRSVVSRFLNTQMNRFEIRTPTAVAGVRGSIIVVGHETETNTSEVSVEQGNGYVSNPDGSGFTNIDARTQATNDGSGGFETSQMTEQDMQDSQSGFETDQADEDAPSTTDGNSSSTTDDSGTDDGTGTTGSDTTADDGDGPKTETVASNDEQQSDGTGTSGESGSGGDTGSDTGTGETSDSFTENDLSAPQLDAIPIQLESPVLNSTVRVVISLPD